MPSITPICSWRDPRTRPAAACHAASVAACNEAPHSSLQLGRLEHLVVRPCCFRDALHDGPRILPNAGDGPARRSQPVRSFRLSSALRQAIDSSHVRKAASTRKPDSFRNAVTNVSWTTSSASALLPSAASAALNTAWPFRSTSSPNASTSPACARRTSASIRVPGGVGIDHMVNRRRGARAGWEKTGAGAGDPQRVMRGVN